MKYTDFSEVIKQIKTKYAVILDYRGKPRPFIVYKMKAGGCVYLETIMSFSDHTNKKFYTYSINSNDELKLWGTSMIWDDNTESAWVSEHQRKLESQKGN